MKVNICGIPHEIVECEDSFTADATHFGQIDYKACEIRINKDLATEAKEETICHEMIHGILVHLGYTEQSQDEQFVQALANAIYQGFEIREDKEVTYGLCLYHGIECDYKGNCIDCPHNTEEDVEWFKLGEEQAESEE